MVSLMSRRRRVFVDIAQGAPQRRLQRARKRPGRRRVDGATQSGLVAVCTAP